MGAKNNKMNKKKQNNMNNDTNNNVNNDLKNNENNDTNDNNNNNIDNNINDDMNTMQLLMNNYKMMNSNNLVNPMNMMNPMNIMNPMNMMNPFNLMDPMSMMNPIIDNNVLEKMETLFKQEYPNFDSNNQEDIEFKETQKNKLQKIYWGINQIKESDKKVENEKKLIINFYDVCQKEIYFDLELNVESLISFLISQILNNVFRIIKRLKKNQNVKYLIENPIPIDYQTYFNEREYPLFFEYEGKNLFDLEQKTGLEIGLKEGSQIQLKIDTNLIKFSKEIIFCEFKTLKELTIKIKTNKKAKIKDLIKEFYKKLGKNFSEEDEFVFLFNAQKLDKNSEKTLEEFNLKGDLKITVLESTHIQGAGMPIDFIEESSGKVKRLNFGEEEPKGRIVKEGLNIFGICNNSKCEYYQKEVIYPKEMNEKLVFNLTEEMPNIKCPICEQIIQPKTLGFWKCEYQLVGKKNKGGNKSEYDSNTKETKEDDFEYFDIFEYGETQWDELIIYVIPKQKMKYELN